MKIAFISYEYPPDTAIGGIATYVYQAAKMLSLRGHHVEVFAGSTDRTTSEVEGRITVHRLQGMPSSFSDTIGRIFAERHSFINFDVLEGTDYAASARGAVKLVSSIPLVVKLHTPGFLVEKINYIEPSFQMKARRFIGALRRIRKPEPFVKFSYDPNHDIERLHILDADEIATPSQDLGVKLVQLWGLPSGKIAHVPYPYTPSSDLLEIPINTHNKIVTFLGRLEIRKGVLDLAEAIPKVLRCFPNTKFRFVGASHPSPQMGMDMQQYLTRKLWRYKNSLEFTGSVTTSLIPGILANTDVCVFPSRWENFPNVCLEAMAAGRGIVGSNAGGMSDMLGDDHAGLLVPPYSPQAIAEAIVKLLKNPTLRMELGQAARDRVLSEYNLDKIGSLQEASYLRAIERRKALGARNMSD